MRLKENSSSKKLLGVYYTPPLIAEAMVKYVENDSTINSIFEPSCGEGVFIEAILKSKLSKSKITALDIDADAINKIKERYSDFDNISLSVEDYFKYYSRNIQEKEPVKYDLILGNPPYIRYQYLTPEQRKELSDILSTNGMKPNKLINAWVGFLVSCVRLLAENGKILFVIPAELLQVAFAENLRQYLSNTLSKISLITFEKLVFPEIEQEVIIFIGVKGKEPAVIRTFEVEDETNLVNLDYDNKQYQMLEHNKEKWTRYFTTPDEAALIHSVKNDSRFQKFSDCALINVGITTGNNSYFSVEKDVVSQYNLENVTLPLIGRSSHAHGLYFTHEDWMKNVDSGKKSQLVWFPDIPYDEYPEGHKQYIEYGNTLKENHGYKCRIRDRWYIVPSVWIPDAFFLRRNNLYPKFVLNSCNGVSTDTMHRIKFKEGLNRDKILLSYYNSISFAFAEICGRSYGGGVLEILPGEVGNIYLPILNNVDDELCSCLLQHVDLVIRRNDDIESALDLVDKEILVGCLGIDESICSTFRDIWRRFQTRRLKRGH